VNVRAGAGVATGILIMSIAAGLLVAAGAAEPLLSQLRGLVGPVTSLGVAALLVLVFFNNAIKALAVIVLGLLGGIPSLLFIVVNGVVIGIVAGGAAEVEGWPRVVAGLTPHGIIEVPALVVATALGFELGRESFKWLLRRPTDAKRRLRAALRLYWVAIAPALLVAALIEVFVTPLVVSLVR